MGWLLPKPKQPPADLSLEAEEERADEVAAAERFAAAVLEEARKAEEYWKAQGGAGLVLNAAPRFSKGAVELILRMARDEGLVE